MSEWLLKMWCRLNFNLHPMRGPSPDAVRQTLQLWSRLNTKLKITNPVIFDKYLGLGVEVTAAAEVPLYVNGVPIYAIVFSPNSEASLLLWEQGEEKNKDE